MTRRLPQVHTHAERLEIPTILDRGLAGLYGPDYVRLCAFAIDLDRVYVLQPDAPSLAFGWEVFLTQCFTLARVDVTIEGQHSLLEDTCLSILEQSPEDQGYGSQLLFAVYHAVESGLYPDSLRPLFRTWRKRPKQLLKALDSLWSHAPEDVLTQHAQHCLSARVASELTPQLTPSTRAALETMQSRGWTLPAKRPRAVGP